jgi:threonine synthase
MVLEMSQFVKSYECTLCHKTYHPSQNIMTCSNCGEQGILMIEYDYEKMKKVVNQAYFENNKDQSMWRYLPLMSIEGKFHERLLKIGFTPLYQANRFHQRIGLNKLFIKDESTNPSQSLKDRASAVAVLKALEMNQDTIACSSTGNAASSLACHAARMGLKTYIFVPKRAPLGKLTQLLIYGANVIQVDGDYRSAFKLSKDAINHYGWYNRNAAINPHLVEGKKTVALEIAEQLNFKPTDWVVVSVGDGCTIAGVYQGFYDLKMLGLIEKIPKLLGVQSEGCAPFVIAHQTKKPLIETNELTIADSIAVGIPRNPVKALRAVIESKGNWISVSDQDIIYTMAKLGKDEGIFAEPAASASFAGLEKAIRLNIIDKNESVTVIHTGNGLKDLDNAQKAIKQPIVMKADLALFNEYYQTKGE